MSSFDEFKNELESLINANKYYQAKKILSHKSKNIQTSEEQYYVKSKLKELAKVDDDITALINTANSFMEKRDYAMVVHMLENIPNDKSYEDCLKLLIKARKNDNEVNNLTASINKKIDGQDYGDIFPSVERLVELQPNKKKMVELLTTLKSYSTAQLKNRSYKTDPNGFLLPSDRDRFWRKLMVFYVLLFLVVFGISSWCMLSIKVVKNDIAKPVQQAPELVEVKNKILPIENKPMENVAIPQQATEIVEVKNEIPPVDNKLLEIVGQPDLPNKQLPNGI